ncbi:hypothetical protein CERSUDRAFT_109441 [Gelatoporia subvermispora B]|uniref:Uncharacterized protein n=1 Tax=Ceriporiopsis subvermispora (strain B) TaxID=914234 RepID=M2QHC0_CERS8|nr:hypothetical protein CERSUDRAFT_109441 [Gelatoporia subvermispora B]
MNMALAFCMGTDIAGIVSNPIGQPVATRGVLVFLSFAISTQFFNGASILIVSPRLVFTFSRDGVPPFSSVRYKLHSRTRTPMRGAWACAGTALLLGLLALEGPTASIAGLYMSWFIPVTSRSLEGKEWVPGAFSLVRWGRPVAVIAVAWMSFAIVVFAFPSTPDSTVSNMNYTAVVLSGWIAMCLVCYHFPVYGGVHWSSRPRSNINGVSSARIVRGAGQKR